MSLAHHADDGGNKPITGEITKEPVKTIAQGMPGDSGEPVVTTVCLLPSAHGPRVLSGIRHSLRPLYSGRENSCKTRARCAARMRRFVLCPCVRRDDLAEGEVM